MTTLFLPQAHPVVATLLQDTAVVLSLGGLTAHVHPTAASTGIFNFSETRACS